MGIKGAKKVVVGLIVDDKDDAAVERNSLDGEEGAFGEAVVDPSALTLVDAIQQESPVNAAELSVLLGVPFVPSLAEVAQIRLVDGVARRDVTFHSGLLNR